MANKRDARDGLQPREIRSARPIRKPMRCHTKFSMVICLVLFALMYGITMGQEVPARMLEAYNVVWDAPSRNSSESMPCGGGDIGLNVWVEDGEVLFYMQRSGSLAETNEYLKMGRMRLRLNPNPFSAPDAVFRQELKLREGYVEILGSAAGEDGIRLDVTLRIWAEVKRPGSANRVNGAISTPWYP